MRRRPVSGLPSDAAGGASRRPNGNSHGDGQPHPNYQCDAALYPLCNADPYDVPHRGRDLYAYRRTDLDAFTPHSHCHADPASHARWHRAYFAGADLDVSLCLDAAARGRRGAP